METSETGNTETRLGYYDQVMDMLDKSLLDKGLMTKEGIEKMRIRREENKNKSIDSNIEVTFLKNGRGR